MRIIQLRDSFMRVIKTATLIILTLSLTFLLTSCSSKDRTQNPKFSQRVQSREVTKGRESSQSLPGTSTSSVKVVSNKGKEIKLSKKVFLKKRPQKESEEENFNEEDGLRTFGGKIIENPPAWCTPETSIPRTPEKGVKYSFLGIKTVSIGSYSFNMCCIERLSSNGEKLKICGDEKGNNTATFKYDKKTREWRLIEAHYETFDNRKCSLFLQNGKKNLRCVSKNAAQDWRQFVQKYSERKN